MTCAPSEDSDQSVQSAWRKLGSLFSPLNAAERRLVGCPVWSESSLGAHAILLVLSCTDLYGIRWIAVTVIWTFDVCILLKSYFLALAWYISAGTPQFLQDCMWTRRTLRSAWSARRQFGSLATNNVALVILYEMLCAGSFSILKQYAQLKIKDDLTQCL